MLLPAPEPGQGFIRRRETDWSPRLRRYFINTSPRFTPFLRQKHSASILKGARSYQDDGVSGAEFETRPGFVRLVNALTRKASFDVLIVSELSRLGRERFETGYALKRLSQAGVKVYGYLADAEVPNGTGLPVTSSRPRSNGTASSVPSSA